MGVNVYQIVTDRIIAVLENGVIPWEKPWTGVRSGAYSRAAGRPYSVLNQLLLRKPGEYLTFKQVGEAGGTGLGVGVGAGVSTAMLGSAVMVTFS